MLGLPRAIEEVWRSDTASEAGERPYPVAVAAAVAVVVVAVRGCWVGRLLEVGQGRAAESLPVAEIDPGDCVDSLTEAGAGADSRYSLAGQSYSIERLEAAGPTGLTGIPEAVDWPQTEKAGEATRGTERVEGVDQRLGSFDHCCTTRRDFVLAGDPIVAPDSSS